MAAYLTRIPFTAELLANVLSFDCGADALWQTEVSDWIKAPPGAGGAADAVASGTLVWLYANDVGDLVGFGSVGETVQRWPSSKDPPIAASNLPYMAVARRFWGQPSGLPSKDRYAGTILRNLIAEAMQHRATRPLLTLQVCDQNKAGIKLYSDAGFKEYHKPRVDQTTGFVYKRMVLVLSDPPA
jgi:hypothetical protein